MIKYWYPQQQQPNNKTVLQVIVSGELVSRLEEQARAQGKSLSVLVEELLSAAQQKAPEISTPAPLQGQ